MDQEGREKGNASHLREEVDHASIPTNELVSAAVTLPLIFDPVQEDDPDVFIITTPKGGCSITYDPPSLLPAVTAFSFEMFDMTSHRCHGYEGRPKGERGPSGEGWTGLYLHVPPSDPSVPVQVDDTESKGERRWSMEVQKDPVEGLKEGLVITASDEIAAIYAVFLLTEAMGLSPWHRWRSHRPPWKPHVAWKRHQKATGSLPPLGQMLTLSDLAEEEWARLASITEDRDAEENLENIIWTAIRLGKDGLKYNVLERLGITQHLSSPKIEKECKTRLIRLSDAP